MPQKASPIKRLRRDEKKKAVNKTRISRIRTFVKKFEKSLVSGEGIEESLKGAQIEIARGVAKGLVHKNTAARKIGRAMKKARAVTSAQ